MRLWEAVSWAEVFSFFSKIKCNSQLLGVFFFQSTRPVKKRRKGRRRIQGCRDSIKKSQPLDQGPEGTSVKHEQSQTQRKSLGPYSATDTLPGRFHGDNQGRAQGNSLDDCSWHIDTLALLPACGKGRGVGFSVHLCLQQQQEHEKSLVNMCFIKKVWSFHAETGGR